MSSTLNSGLSEPLFQLYLYFLGPQLDMLAKLNRWLQHSSMSLHVVYSNIQALIKALLLLIAIYLLQKKVTTYQFMELLKKGTDFLHLLDCVNHSLLTERQLAQAKVNIFANSLSDRFRNLKLRIHLYRSKYETISGSSFSNTISYRC